MDLPVDWSSTHFGENINLAFKSSEPNLEEF